MATVPPTKLRSLYRALLRELPPRPLLAAPRSPLHERLRGHFEPSSSSSSSSSAFSSSSSSSKSLSPSAPASSATDAEAEVAQAEQFLAYLRAQRVYATLLERYNPGMDMDQEERVRLTARRVGMDLPVEFGAGGQEHGGGGGGEGRK